MHLLLIAIQPKTKEKFFALYTLQAIYCIFYEFTGFVNPLGVLGGEHMRKSLQIAIRRQQQGDSKE